MTNSNRPRRDRAFPRLALSIGFLAVGLGLAGGCSRPTADPEPETEEGVEARAKPAFREEILYEGLSIELTITPLVPGDDPPTLVEGQDVRFEFTIRDTTTGAPVARAYPAAWMDLRLDEDEPPAAQRAIQKAESFINGSIFAPPELDLNVFRVLVLGEDATITVVDPFFQFGGTKLLEVIPLPSAGSDWTLSADQAHAWVACPEANSVSVVSTAEWDPVAEIADLAGALRVDLQPDGRYAWVTGSSEEVALIDTRDHALETRIAVGRGPHEMAFAPDSRFAFVSCALDDEVVVVDVQDLSVAARVPVGEGPVSIDYSSRAAMAYVACRDGSIVAIDGRRHEVVATLEAAAGLGQLRVAPKGRFVFVLQPEGDRVFVVDTATNRITREGETNELPAKLSFSDEFAYVWHRASTDVIMVPLAEIDRPGEPLRVFEVPAGQRPAVESTHAVASDAIVQAPGGSAVLVASPADKSVFYYKEGMAAPQGSFDNDGREAHSPLVVDRSLRERTEAGVYETVGRLRRPGNYDIVFFLDAPRILHCFELTVAPDHELEEARKVGRVEVRPRAPEHDVRPGEPLRLAFELSEMSSGEPRVGAEDVKIMLMKGTGVWHTRTIAVEEEDGLYVAEFVPPHAGIYHSFVESPSLGFTFSDSSPLLFVVEDHEDEEDER